VLIFVDTPHYAAFGNSKGLDNVNQFARTLNAQLCREHAKASQIPFVMLEDGLCAAEVRPLSVLPDDADQITDACGIFRNEWQ
jgi:capsule polysaccharide export protein KpsC/LpsZ